MCWKEKNACHHLCNYTSICFILFNYFFNKRCICNVFHYQSHSFSNVSIPSQSNDLVWESFIVYHAYIWISKTENDFSLDTVHVANGDILNTVGHWFVTEPNSLVQVSSTEKPLQSQPDNFALGHWKVGLDLLCLFWRAKAGWVSFPIRYYLWNEPLNERLA